MKPLNRPMFRYGGPIKQGIMNGMKDNRQAINTVGSPLAPKDESGRGGYAFPLLGFAGAAGLQALRTGAMRMAPRIASYFRSKPFIEGGGKGIAGKYVPAPLTRTEKIKQFFQTAPAGKYLAGSPEGRLATSLITGSGKITKPIKSVVTGAMKSPLTIGTAGVYGTKGLYNALTGEKEPEVQKEIETAGGPPGGGDPNMFATPKPKAGDPDKKDDLTKDRIQKTKERYYKLMGIDKMNKDAVYDSLIDASKIISEEGADLKGAVKSGTLQNRIIQAISGQLDKSAALKRQIDAAVLKGEIEKDIKANDPSAKLAAEYTKKRIELADKQLAGGDLDDIAATYRKQGLSLKGQNLFTEASRKGIQTQGILPTEAVDDFKQENPTLTEADFVNIYVF